jgi:hypothetical protein
MCKSIGALNQKGRIQTEDAAFDASVDLPRNAESSGVHVENETRKLGHYQIMFFTFNSILYELFYTLCVKLVFAFKFEGQAINVCVLLCPSFSELYLSSWTVESPLELMSSK